MPAKKRQVVKKTKDHTNKDTVTSNDTVNPRVDLAFKKLFGVEENKDLLISLINSIVSKEDQVTDVTLLNPYNLQNFKKDKLSVLDIKATDSKGQMYNIEMQITDEDDYDKRALYYWAKLYSGQLKKSLDYCDLKKAIGIHILNFVSIPGTDEYHNTFHVTEKKSGVRHFKDMELHTIELRKFEKDKVISDELKSYLSKVKTSLDRWVMFLTKNSLLNAKALPKELSDPAIKKALNALSELNFTEAEREEYEEHLKWLRTEASGIKKAETTSFAAGVAEGEKIGEARGETKGAHKKAIAIAKNLLTKKLDVKSISEVTGLNEKEIKALK